MSVYHKTSFMMNYIIRINHVPVYLKQFYIRYSNYHCYQYKHTSRNNGSNDIRYRNIGSRFVDAFEKTRIGKQVVLACSVTIMLSKLSSKSGTRSLQTSQTVRDNRVL